MAALGRDRSYLDLRLEGVGFLLLPLAVCALRYLKPFDEARAVGSEAGAKTCAAGSRDRQGRIAKEEKLR